MVIILNAKAKRMQQLDLVYKTCSGAHFWGMGCKQNVEYPRAYCCQELKEIFECFYFYFFSKLNTFYGIFYQNWV